VKGACWLVVKGVIPLDQILYDREGPHGTDVDLRSLVLLHARLAHQLGAAVDLRAARPAVGGLAVPAHREVAGLVRLHVEDRVEDHHPLDEGYLVLDLLASFGVAAEDPELRRPTVRGRHLVRVDGSVRLGGHVLPVCGVVVQIYPS
jgi:hypothetical protein